MNTKLRNLLMVAMLCAVSFVAVLVGRLVPNVAGFLSYDPKDAVVVIAGFMFGPLTSVIIAVVVALVEMVTVSTTGIIGLVMNVLSTCAFAVPAALLYRYVRRMSGAVLGLITGVLTMTACMLLWNYLITPLYMHVDRSVVVGMLLPVFAPFNLIKGGINAALALVLYKPVVTALRKARLLPQSQQDTGNCYRVVYLLLWLAILAAFVLLFWIFTK